MDLTNLVPFNLC